MGFSDLRDAVLDGLAAQFVERPVSQRQSMAHGQFAGEGWSAPRK
jgi:hypothetical protein